MRVSLAGLLVLFAMLIPRAGQAQLVADLYPDARMAAAPVPVDTVRYTVPIGVQPGEGRRPAAVLGFGGLLGGAAGLAAGMYAGAKLDSGNENEGCDEWCIPLGLIYGGLAGEALGIALGVHLANDRRGSLPMGMLASAGILSPGSADGPGRRERPAGHSAGADRGNRGHGAPHRARPLTVEPVPPHESFTLHSAALGETRRINVYTPPDAADARLPVLYIPDGGVHEDFPHVAAAVDAAIRAGEMRPLLVAGMENTERRRDMTGPTTVDEDRRIAPRVGGSAAFRAFIADELMPEVRRRCRASDETAIMGESLAGLFAVETFLLQPALFRTCIALSPSLWWNGQSLVRGAAEHVRARRELPGILYLSSADEPHIVSACERLADVLRATAPPALRWRYQPRPDLTHATIYRALAPQVLREIFPPEG